jgi:hypothetical protein
MVSTLFTTVGAPNKPTTAGKGGRMRGWPHSIAQEPTLVLVAGRVAFFHWPAPA